MSNNKWMDDPILNNISTEKLEALTKIIEGAKGMDPKKMFVFFLTESNNARKNGVNFTNEETELILNVLKQNMTAEEIKRIDTVRKMVSMIEKNKQKK